MTGSTIRICEVMPGISSRSGGPSSFLSDLSFHIPANGFRFDILTEGEPSPLDVALDARVALHRVPTASTRLLTLIQSPTTSLLDEMAEQLPIDVVHSHGLWRNVSRLAARWARGHSVPLVISPHGTLEPWALRHKWLKKQIALAAYQRRDLASARAFHACSHKEAEGIRRLGLKQPIAAIPNGTNLPPLHAIADHADRSVRTVFFLSRLHPVKGLPMLLEAWKTLAPQNWRIVIAGPDEKSYLRSLSRQANDLGIAHVVEFTGPVFGEAKAHAFKHSDLFVLPSYSENFGIVVAEALSYGVPVLATTGSPWQELEAHGCGWWVSPTVTGIREGLAKALETTSDDRRKMGLRGRRLIEDRYQWPAIAERFRQFYRWIVDRGPRPDFIY